MPISKPDHIQVHRIEFGKGTHIPKLVEELEISLQTARYAAWATAGVTVVGAGVLGWGLYKLAQGVADELSSAAEDLETAKGWWESAKMAWFTTKQTITKPFS